jgi:thiamine biosynthesis lipoprotein ApbE
MLADGLSAALTVTPSDGASRLLAHFPGVTALVTLPDGRTNQLVGSGI